MPRNCPTLLESVTLLISGAASLLLAGCQDQLAFNCKHVSADILHVARDQSCRFNFDGGDAARYAVQVVKPPTFGDAVPDGKYLKYTAKRGFTGEDRMTIKVERRGIGHLQWQTHNLKIKVGPSV